MDTRKLAITTISGSPRACGRAYGEAFATLILGWARQELKPDQRRLAYARKCWPSIRRHAPAAAAFLQGEAEGANLSLDHAVLVALHEEVCHLPHCTAFAATGAATRGGKTIIAQNWDWSTAAYPWAGLLRLRMSGGPGVATLHYPGMWNCAGINEEGLALLWTSGGFFPKVRPKVGVPTYVLIAEVLRRKSVAAAVAYLEAVPNAGAFIFLLADAGGAVAVVEALPGRKMVDRSGDQLLRGNHFLCGDIVRCGRQTRPSRRKSSTLQRTERMTQLMAEHRGRITPRVTREVLTDRGSAWPWLHQFPGGPKGFKLESMTVDSLYAVCQERELWTCRGGREAGGWQCVRP